MLHLLYISIIKSFYTLSVVPKENRGLFLDSRLDFNRSQSVHLRFKTAVAKTTILADSNEHLPFASL